MGTAIRPELSEKNKYWIEKHRYYELKHFCLQYPTWKKAYMSMDGLSKQPTDLAIFSNAHSDPTVKCASSREFYFERLKLIERTAMTAGGSLWRYILKGVTEGISYDHLKARLEIPCSKDAYYDLYRRFFWLLSEDRK